MTETPWMITLCAAYCSGQAPRKTGIVRMTAIVEDAEVRFFPGQTIFAAGVVIALAPHVPRLVQIVFGIVKDGSMENDVVPFVTLANDKWIALMFCRFVQLL